MGHVPYPVSAVQAVQEKSPRNIGYYLQVRVRISAIVTLYSGVYSIIASFTHIGLHTQLFVRVLFSR